MKNPIIIAGILKNQYKKPMIPTRSTTSLSILYSFKTVNAIILLSSWFILKKLG